MFQANLFNPSDAPLLSVSQLNQYLRQLLEGDSLLQKIWVQGEVSNCSQPKSGHIYFTLKDDAAALNCVIWRSQAERMRMLPQNGYSIEARGAISVYEQGGRYQLYVDMVRIAGEGSLYQQFMELKERLETEGLFDSSRKRSLPVYPLRIGIVTSATGAALQDILNVLRQRYCLAEVILSPAAVQGNNAPDEIVRAIFRLNQPNNADVIIIARGGGSLEDLWCFNDERVVRAIAASAIPIITGIGHETDYTLSDLAADTRAPTPSAAAMTATPDQRELAEALSSQQAQLARLAKTQVEWLQVDLREHLHRLNRSSPGYRVRNEMQRFDELERRLSRAVSLAWQKKTQNTQALQARLVALSPKNILQRGYALVESANGSLVNSIHQVQAGDQKKVILADGHFSAVVGETRISEFQEGQ